MEQLITAAAQRFGVDPGMIRMVLGKMLEFAQNRLEGGSGQQLLAQIPGAQSLVASAQDSPGGGGLAGLVGKVGSMFGGSTGAAAGLTAAIKESGLDAGQVGGLASMLVDFVRDNVSPDTAAQLQSALPQAGDLPKTA